MIDDPLLRGLRLDDLRRRDIVAAIRARIAAGLQQDHQEIRALPAWLPPPSPLDGEALVVDAGGTNVRAAVVAVSAEGGAVLRGPSKARLEVRDAAGTRAGFFGQQAELARQVEPPAGAPVGYCFSYPSEVHQGGDATLLAWTKGIVVDGVVGTRVGAGLSEALVAAGLAPGRVTVLNDTVAALLAGAGRGRADPSRTVGLIVGTGTNMAAFFDPAGTKLGGDQPMAVNLESGNLCPPHLTALDDEIDASSADRGRQRFEKAVSGHWLPRLLARACPDLAVDLERASAAVVDASTGDSRAADIASALLDRSADLVACGLAALAELLPGDGPVSVVAEGGLYWNAPSYDARVRATYASLTHEALDVVRVEDANLVGAAVAALTDI